MFLESIKLALDTLRSHKLRTFLTLLGVIISVTTLIAVVSIIEGMNVYISERMANLGSNVFTINRFGIITSAKEWVEAQRRRKIMLEDYDAIRDHMKLARAVGAQAFWRADVRYENQLAYDVGIRGVTANMVHISTEQVEAGRYISETDYERRITTAFIGRDVADKLFPGLDPMGKQVVIRGNSFQVVGIAKSVGSVFGQSQDNFVIIPLTTFLKIYGSSRFVSLGIQVQALSAGMMNDAQDEARLLLRARRHLKWEQKDDFGIVSSESILTMWQNLTGTIAAVAVGVTSVFLVVGGIVIMNIMLASVTERTHEIGIRKSLGARRRDILWQFLVESAALSTAGGVFGVLMAWVGTRLMTALTPIPSSLPMAAVATAVLMSAAVGLFFGIYPANKAARLDPIVALRSE